MGFLNNQKISNVQWIGQTPDVLTWRFPDADQVLQNNSTIIVGPGQAALFVSEGKPQGIINTPGSTDLQTANTPFLTSMLSIFRGGDSKHKGKVFFFNMTQITDVKWGTPAPLKYVDPVYKFPVGLRAFGNYTFTISDPMKFFTEFVGDRDAMTLDEFKQTINSRVITPITDALASAKFSFVDIDSNREELSKTLSTKISGEFAAFGFTMSDFRIESTDFDDATQKRVDSISDVQAQAQAINSLGSIDPKNMAAYAQLQQLQALKMAAGNPNGIAGAGVAAGAGIGLGAAMAQGINQNNQQQAQVPPQQPPQTPPPSQK
jgi:membrane protease subunit (stomatin/prohibitin family)